MEHRTTMTGRKSRFVTRLDTPCLWHYYSRRSQLFLRTTSATFFSADRQPQRRRRSGRAGLRLHFTSSFSLQSIPVSFPSDDFTPLFFLFVFFFVSYVLFPFPRQCRTSLGYTNGNASWGRGFVEELSGNCSQNIFSSEMSSVVNVRPRIDQTSCQDLKPSQDSGRTWQ